MLVGLGGERRAEDQLRLDHGQVDADGLELRHQAGVVILVVTRVVEAKKST